MPVKPTPPQVRFELKFTRGPDDKCWLWQGAKKTTGYGNFSMAPGEFVAAHVAAYRIYRGAVPKGMYVCHRCDQPSCVNPVHLFLGTPKQNQEDMRAKGRDAHGMNRRLPLSAIDDVMAARRRGVPLKALAIQYGVSEACISVNARGLTKANAPGRNHKSRVNPA